MNGHRLLESTRLRVLERDGHACTVSRLLGGRCRGLLHIHHIEPVAEGGSDDDDNLATVCASHHTRWEALRRALVASRRRDDPPRCPHRHTTQQAREICESQLARAAARAERRRRRTRALVSA
jgi:5-methylcytosine-specific restriction endonuclease McrA